MTVNSISPFLRFVNIIFFEPLQKFCRAPDCHFFYMLDEYTRLNIAGKVYEMKAGTVAIVPAGTEYYFEHQGRLSLISINFDYTSRHSHRDRTIAPVISERFDESTITEIPAFEDCTVFNSPIIAENMFHLKQYLDIILSEHTFKKQCYAEASSAQFKYVLLELMRATVNVSKGNDSADFILSYIQKHFSEDLTNENLASLVGYNSYHLNRLVKNATGTTLHKYLTSCRMEHARKYLRETELSVSDISELCGYKNFCNFSKDFKKKTGLSPVKYRKAVQNMI